MSEETKKVENLENTELADDLLEDVAGGGLIAGCNDPNLKEIDFNGENDLRVLCH